VSLPCLRQVNAGVEIFLYLQPRASLNKVVGIQGEELKVSLTAPPVDGAANKACCAFFAKLCRLPKSNVRLVSGETSRHKRLLLENADFKQVGILLEDLLRG
jgi:uncharacterized protein (TIGR00251 family)